MIHKTSREFDKKVIDSPIGAEFELDGQIYVRFGESWKYLIPRSILDKDPDYTPDHPFILLAFTKDGDKMKGLMTNYINERGYIIDGEFTNLDNDARYLKELKSHYDRKYRRFSKLGCEKTRGKRFKKTRGYRRKYQFAWLAVYPLMCDEYLDPNKSKEDLDKIRESRRKSAREILNNVISGRYKIKVEILMGLMKKKSIRKAILVPVDDVREYLPENYPDNIKRV